MKLYTKTGDAGESGLASGHRLAKDSLIFEILGTLDETNAFIGSAVSMIETKELRHELMQIQDDLLLIGAVIAGSKKVVWDDVRTEALEKKIDEYQSQFGKEWFTKFILPGGTELASRLDIARTVSRRAERLIVTYVRDHQDLTAVQRYVNRLSDYLFSLRCVINNTMKHEETEFRPKYLEVFGK